MSDTDFLERLYGALERSWGEETSSDPENWKKENPAWGQCAATSLVLQDILGGVILWCNAKLPDKREISHYFNNVEGSLIDITKKQFPLGTIVPSGAPKTKEFKTTRDYILSYPQTKSRYAILRLRFDSNFS